MAFDKPQSRNEAILQNMLGANNELEPPKSRVEALLQELSGKMPEANPSEGTTTGTLERLKIGDEIYSVEGGGSGTSDYDALNNKPQIAGTTLSGNKSLADLGIASATTVSGILDGTGINSFGDVETALGDKVDKVNGKGLSTNDYDDTEKAAVAAATTAIAGIKDGTAIDSFGDVETALGAIQDGQSIDSFADVESALSDVDDDVDSLKSGLTTLDNEVNGDATTYPYADVITIEDAIPANVADCKVKIEPVQDLHGQSAPYVGGAGKNKLPLTTAKLKADNVDGTWNGNVYSYRGIDFTITEDNGGNVIEIDVNGTSNADWAQFGVHDVSISQGNYILNGISNGSTAGLRFDLTGIGDYKTLTNTELPLEVSADTTYTFNIMVRTSGTVVSHHKVYPMIRLATETDATFAPYTNICPISGHTEASVQRDGKNHFDKNNINSFIGYIDTTRQYYVSNIQYKSCYIKCEPNTAYTISKVAGKTFRVASSIDAPENGVPFINTEVNHTGTNITITTGSNARYLTVLYWSSANEDTLTPAEIEQTIQIELGSTATPYEPYAGKTYTIALGDTIYGGTVDFDSGVLTVTHGYVDVSTLSFQLSADNRWYTSADYGFKHVPNNIVTPSIMDRFPAFSANGLYNDTTAIGFSINENGNLAIRNGSTVDTPTGNLCYELAEPFTIQLTPQQIQLLQGQNTLTASTGDISVTVNGVSGAIGAVQEQVNELAEDVAKIETLDYSTTEQKTGQKWIDGKDIYFRVNNTPLSILANDTWYSSGFTGIDTVVNYIASLTRDNEQIGDGFNNGKLDYVIRSNEMLIKGSNFTLTDTYVVVKQILYYTKAT